MNDWVSLGILNFQQTELHWRALRPWPSALSVGYLLAVLSVLVACSTVVVWFYLGERGKLSPVRRGLLVLLRSAIVLIVALLLLDPALVAPEPTQDPHRPIYVLLDNSQSMNFKDSRVTVADRARTAMAAGVLPTTTPLTDPKLAEILTPFAELQPTRAEQLAAVLKHPDYNLLKRLSNRGPLQFYLFGNQSRLTDREDESIQGLDFQDANTSLHGSLAELLKRSEHNPPAAIVVLTDGRDTASPAEARSVIEERSEALQVPLHIYGVGCSEVGNLQLRSANAPEMLFAEDHVVVPVRWHAQGLEGKAEITITLDGEVVARESVPIQPGLNEKVLIFTPKKSTEREKRMDLVTSIRYDGQEAFQEDNFIKRSITLLDRKVRVLLLEKSPRWEYKFLMQFLNRDRRVGRENFKIHLLDAERDSLTSGPPYLERLPATAQELIEQFDLVVLGDVPSAAIGMERMNWLRDFVDRGGGLVVLAGQHHNPASYVKTPLAELFPIEIVVQSFPYKPGERFLEFHPQRTEFGKYSDLLYLADKPEENESVWKELPGIHWHYPVEEVRPGARSLLVHPTRKTRKNEPMPIMLSQRYGKGQVLFLGMDETWRWRFNHEDKYYGRFWGQVLYQLGTLQLTATPRRAQLTLEGTDQKLNDNKYLYANLLDEQFQPLEMERVSARLVRPDDPAGRPIMLERVPDQKGVYRVLLTHDAVGEHQIVLNEPIQATLDYRVQLPPMHELSANGMAEEELRTLAQATRGKFYREEDLQRLPDEVMSRRRDTLSAPHRELDLYNWVTWSAFVLLITLEWLLRKFSDLC